jgi:hypothetical protein
VRLDRFVSSDLSRTANASSRRHLRPPRSPHTAISGRAFERLRERKITAEDLYQLKLWRESEPEALDGLLYGDSGSFKICGEGTYPKTFLLAGQPAKGEKL